MNDSTTPAPIIPPAPPQVGRLVPYWDPGLKMAAAVDNAVARLDAKLVAFDKMTETVTDMALRKTLSELPRSIDRMNSDRHRRAIWSRCCSSRQSSGWGRRRISGLLLGRPMSDDPILAALARLEAGQGKLREELESGLLSVEAIQSRLRVDLMARMDRLQDALTATKGHATMAFTVAHGQSQNVETLNQLFFELQKRISDIEERLQDDPK